MKLNKPFFSAILFAAAVAVSTTSIFAKNYNVVVKSGKTQEMVRFSLFDQIDCGAAAYPKYKITQPPHGTITVKKFRGKLTVKGHCHGKLAKGMSISYRSKRGYRGADAGKVDFSFPRGADGSGYTMVNTVRFKLRVK